MILYLAGKYRGDIDANIQAAREVAIKLWEAGHFALCPHLNTAHFEVDCSVPEETYIERDLEMLARCDAVVMLPGSGDSEGAKREHAHALKLGIPVYYWPDYPPINSEPNRERYPLHAFTTQVAKRLEHGAREYGAESYLTDNVTRQIEEELLDIAGWASLGWAKLKRVEELWRELRGLVGSEEPTEVESSPQPTVNPVDGSKHYGCSCWDLNQGYMGGLVEMSGKAGEPLEVKVDGHEVELITDDEYRALNKKLWREARYDGFRVR